jgi:hypothetical protein
MSVSVRSHVVAGVAAIAVSATVLAPVVVSVPGAETPVSAGRVDLAASVKPLVTEPLSPETVATARAVIERIDPDAQLPLQTAAIVVPTPQNGLSNAIIAGYQFIQYWVSYGVDLADYVLGFIPYGYLIGDQINLVYDFLIRPISDSVVYGLVVPVVNDPLNIWSYVNGAVIVGQTTINALINTGIAEFNYFFGWLIPPLPPLPLAATEAIETTEVTALKTLKTLETAEVTESVDEPATETAADEHDANVTDAVDTAAAELEPAETPKAEVTEVAAEPVAAEPEAETKTPESTTTSAGGVQAQGEVRGGNATSGDAKPAEATKPGNAKDEKAGPEKEKAATEPAESTAGEAGTENETGKKDAGNAKD